MKLKLARPAALRAACALGLAAALALSVPTSSWAGAVDHPRSRTAGLVAMGDSFASGEGTFDYLPGTDTATNRCHRSDLAYGSLLGRIPRVGPTTLVACSGAATADLLAPNDQVDEPAQVDALTNRTRYVTLTIGGNDIGFSTVLTACVLAATQNQACSADPRLSLAIDSGLAELAGTTTSPSGTPPVYPITRVLAEIARRSPQAEIVVTGYPELFGADPADATPAPGAPGGARCVLEPTTGLAISYTDTQWLNAQTRRLDTVLAAAVRTARRSGIAVRYADPVPLFEGHGRCDRRTPWINPLSVVSLVPLQVSSEGLHPTPRGQRAYFAAVVLSAVR